MAENPQDKRELGYYSLAQVGVEMAAPIGLGWWVDQYLGWFPWLTVLGSILGFILGIVTILKVVNRIGADAKPPEEKGS